jgi:hypothetical protein
MLSMSTKVALPPINNRHLNPKMPLTASKIPTNSAASTKKHFINAYLQ